MGLNAAMVISINVAVDVWSGFGSGRLGAAAESAESRESDLAVEWSGYEWAQAGHGRFLEEFLSYWNASIVDSEYLEANHGITEYLNGVKERDPMLAVGEEVVQDLGKFILMAKAFDELAQDSGREIFSALVQDGVRYNSLLNPNLHPHSRTSPTSPARLALTRFLNTVSEGRKEIVQSPNILGGWVSRFDSRTSIVAGLSGVLFFMGVLVVLPYAVPVKR